jgi:hyperosmotically inducible protein
MTMSVAGCNRPPEATGASLPVATAATETAAGNIQDIDVTTNVKTALLRDTSIKRFDIAVVTLKGDVQLRGTVDTRRQAEQAIKVARGVDGVHSIHDELIVGK